MSLHHVGAYTAFGQQRPKIPFHNHEITNIFLSRCSYQFNKSAPEIKNAQRAIFIYVHRMRMRTGEKAVRTAAKRRTRVRRLCECTILQGDEAQRNNPVIRPRNKKTPNGRFFIYVHRMRMITAVRRGNV